MSTTLGGAALAPKPALADAGNTSAAGASAGTPSAAAIVATAQRYVGYPYATIGDTPSTGFSCIGFAHFVFAQNGIYVPEDLGQAYAAAPAVDQAHLQPGDLVFFQNTVWAGISHVDIYIGDGRMIGADSYQTGVRWDTLGDAYWQQHYLGATRPLSTVAGTATTVTAASGPPATALPTMVASPSATVAPTGATVDPSAAATPAGSPGSPLSTPDPAESPSPPSAPALAAGVGMTVTALRDAPIYADPGDDETDTTQIDAVTPSMPLTVLRARGAWVYVSYDGDDGARYGWVRVADLDLPGAQAAAASGGSGDGSPWPGPAAGITGTAIAGQGASNTTLVVRRATATVYSAPSTGSAIVVTLTAGAGVVALWTQGPWDRVALPDGTVGWVDASAVAPGTPSGAGANAGVTPRRQSTPRAGGGSGAGPGAGASAAADRQAVVTADVLFVRAGPDRRARILRRVHAGDRLHILAAAQGWDYIRQRDGARGWVSARWIAVTSPAHGRT